MSEKKIGFIGCGNMAKAIIGGILRKGFGGILNVYDTVSDACKAIAADNVVVKNNADEVILDSDIIFLAVKPQHIAGVFENITADFSQKLFVTILAGVSTEYIRLLAKNNDLKVIRAMPNTPLLVGEGATALCKTDNVSDEEFEYVFNIFSGSGIATKISENKMNEIISINGSSPAYLFLFAMAVQEYARSVDISEDTALKLFAQTLIGSAKMMLESGKTPEELKIMVSSPGGTTLAALGVMEERGFPETIKEAMDACTKRAYELGK